MVYMGSKARIADDILLIIKEKADEYGLKNYYEPFCGGCAVAEKVVEKTNLNVYCSDTNKYLIALYDHVTSGKFDEYLELTREQYEDIRGNIGNNKYPDWLTAYAGICCSFRGRWMSGYAMYDVSCGRKFQEEHYNNLMRSKEKLKQMSLKQMNYWEIGDIKNSIIYCDAPYRNTRGYIEESFDYDEYYQWLKKMAQDNFVLISEYRMPRGFKEIKTFELKGCIGGMLNDQPDENLYIIKDGKFTEDSYEDIDISQLI